MTDPANSIHARVLGDLAPLATWWHEMSPEGDSAALSENINVVSVSVHIPGNELLTTAANALCATLTNKDAANVTTLETTDSGELDYERWMAACEATRDQLFQWRAQRADPEQLQTLVPQGIKQTVESIAGAADVTRPALLLDGPVAAAAALLAYELAPDCLERIRPLSLGATQVETVAWEYLRIPAVLPLHTALDGDKLAPVAIDLINLATFGN